MTNLEKIALSQALFAAFAFGVAPILAKMAGTAGVAMAFFIFCLRAPQFFGLAAFLIARKRWVWPDRKTVRACALLGLLAVGFNYCHYQAVQYMDIALVTVLIFLFPLILAGMSVVLDGVRLTRAFVLSLLVALLGIGLVFLPNLQSLSLHPLGIGLATLGAVLIAINLFVAGRALQNNDTIMVGCLMNFVPTLVYGFLVWQQNYALPTGSTVWSILIFASAICLLGQITFYAAIQKISALRVSLVMKAEPIFSVAIAVLLLHEAISPIQILGVILVIGALFAAAKPATISDA
jgi:drug/metabolite transporter (DMT)-like permease